MDVLAVGAGRDGTVSLAEMLREIYALNGVRAEVFHEYEAHTFYNLFAQFKEDNDPTAWEKLNSLVSSCRSDAIAGNGYHMVLDLFLARFPDLKLISIKRRDKRAHIESLKRVATMWPEVFVGYSADEGLSRRICAYHLGEMTRDEWHALSLDERLEWYRDNVYSTVEGYRDRAAGYLEIDTESLDDPHTRQQIADFVIGPGAAACGARHQNRAQPLSLDDFSPQGAKRALWWFRDFVPARFEHEPRYGAHYSRDMYRKWGEFEAVCAFGLRPPETDPTFGLTPDALNLELHHFKEVLDYYLTWANGLQQRIARGTAEQDENR